MTAPIPGQVDAMARQLAALVEIADEVMRNASTEDAPEAAEAHDRVVWLLHTCAMLAHDLRQRLDAAS